MADKGNPKKTKNKPAKKTPAEPQVVDLNEEEKKIQANYPDRKIVKGSIRDAGTIKEFGNKRTVEIRCGTEGCKTTRRVATSDLHQVGHCEPCIKDIRLERRKNARGKTKKKPDKTAPKTQPTKTPIKGNTTKPPGKGKPTKPAAKKNVTVPSPQLDQPPHAAPVPPPVDANS